MKLITQNENRPGYKETIIGWIPEEWEIMPLGQIGVFLKGKGITNSQKKKSGLPCITYGEIYTKHDFVIKEINSFINQKTAERSQLIQKNDILFAGSGETLNEIGKCVTNPFNDKVFAGGDIVIFTPNGNDSLFLSFLINSNYITRFRRKLGQGHSVVHIYSSGLKTLNIPLPPLPEQKKIASILSIWDTAIEKTNVLIKAKEQVKKGLMQRLLTGNERFKEFQLKDAEAQKFKETKFGPIPNDWQYEEIGKFALQITEKNDSNNLYPVLSCTKHFGLVDSLKYFNKQVFSENLKTYKIVKRNQFAYATNHIEEGSIGYQDMYDFALISPMYTVFKTKNIINDYYLYSLFKTELYRHIFEINTSASVNRRGSLRWHQFSKIRIPLPSYKEQQKIVSVLSICDKEIDLLKKEKSDIEQQKKGLMQMLLTGSVRVSI